MNTLTELFFLLVGLCLVFAVNKRYPNGMYEGMFVQVEDVNDNKLIEYIDGPFPYFINSSYRYSAQNNKLLIKDRDISQTEGNSWEQCEPCFDCCCGNRDKCFKWCDRCNDDYFYDCPRPDKKCPDCKPVVNCNCATIPPCPSCNPVFNCFANTTCPDCICNVTSNGTTLITAPEVCSLKRPVVSNGEENPQVDVTKFNGILPINGTTVVSSTASLRSLSSSRTINYVSQDYTVTVTGSPATLQFLNPGSSLNPRHTSVFSCDGAITPCNITVCQVDQIPGLGFSVNQTVAIDPLYLNVASGALTLIGTIEIGHSG